MAAVPEEDLPDALRGTAVPEEDLPAPTATTPAPAPTKREERKRSPRAFGLEPGAPLYKEGSLKEGAKQVVGALLETPLSMVSAGGASIAGGAVGAARTGYELLRGRGLDESTARGLHTMESVQRGLTYQPRTEAAQTIQRGIGAGMGAVSEGLGEVGARVGGVFGPKGEAAGRTLGEHAINIAGAAEGVKGLTSALKESRAARIGPPAPLPQPQQAIREAQDAGFKAQPSVAKPSVTSSTLETLADPQRTRAYLSEQNATHASRLAREDIGLPKNAPLDERSISTLRATHNAKYDNIKSLPDLIPNDARYTADIRGLDAAFQNIKEHVPDLYNQSNLERVRAALAQSQSPATGGQWTPAALIDISKRLRSDATTLLGSRDMTPDKLGAAMAMKKGASAVEGLLERHLQSTGNVQLLREFRSARRQLAKIHTIEETTNLVTGEINPQAVRALMENGEKLDGNLLKIGRAAAAMPGVMQSTESAAGKGLGHLSDLGAGHAAARMAMGHADAAAGTAGVLGVRPGIRKLLGSAAYQRRMATPTPSPAAPAAAIPMRAAAPALAAGAITSPAYKLEDESTNR